MARVLIVDDSSMMRRNLKMMLERAGHSIIAEASDGLQAFQEYKMHQPDLVTMDITMPGINGVDTIKNIMAEFPDAVIVVVSALNTKHLVLEALKNGAKYYIIKPINMEKLLAVINEVLVRYHHKESG